ncbi:hypothetical protein IFM89_027427 [Coptis chinensis]|uniref:RRM domain-containing protein n=1 Tax=Coptis chinensis TaxID=261450 RepID=A0A835H8U7_9MAGN|nr:hypothetical protein IFM89_027427 [Coptis chinensis]
MSCPIDIDEGILHAESMNKTSAVNESIGLKHEVEALRGQLVAVNTYAERCKTSTLQAKEAYLTIRAEVEELEKKLDDLQEERECRTLGELEGELPEDAAPVPAVVSSLLTGLMSEQLQGSGELNVVAAEAVVASSGDPSSVSVLNRAIKIKNRQRLRQKRRRFLERPLKEVSTGNTVGGEEDQLSVCLVVNMKRDYRWYELNPTFNTGSSKSKIKYCPCLLFELPCEEALYGFTCVSVDSKVYIIGGLDCDSQLPDDHRIPSSTVQVIDTPSFGKTVSLSVGTAMYGGKSSAARAVLDGKIYVFGSLAKLTGELWAEVFDPATNRWECLPYPSEKVINLSKSRVGTPVVYEKRKKILVFYNGVCECYFDVSTHLWKYDLTLPIRKDCYMNGGGSVIVDDRLYMFCLPQKELYAYDLVQGGQDFIPVHGLEKAVESINLHDRRAGYTHMFHLGNGVICMVWLVGTFSSHDVNCVEYYRIHCLKFHVNERDGFLHAVVDRCDYYFLKGFVDVFDCFAMKRATHSENRQLGAIVRCSLSGDQQTMLKTNGTSQVTRHARRVYVEGFSSVNPQTIETFFNDSITSSCNSGIVCDVYVDKEKKFAIVEMRSEQAASCALELNGSLFEDVKDALLGISSGRTWRVSLDVIWPLSSGAVCSVILVMIVLSFHWEKGAELKIRRPTDYNCKKDPTFEFTEHPYQMTHPRSYWQRGGRGHSLMRSLSEKVPAPAM